MSTHRALFTVALLAAAAGCVKAYLPPAPGEPAALLKVKVGWDPARAVAALPDNAHTRRLVLEVHGVEQLAGEQQTWLLASRTWPEALAPAGAPTLDAMVPVSLHADRPLVVHVSLGAKWKVTTRQLVWKEERTMKPVTRTETVFGYDPVTRRNESRQVTRTVHESVTERKQVWEDVTKEQGLGCTASLPLRPARDATYLLDYVNLALSEGCTVQGWLQKDGGDGAFQLAPL